uniref:Uncharacterized protein n=1 Tax=Ananas comosus var. bracteatus TaxID=296719 RepID=A0A6V7NJH8_ANACO|nr:unnamed protein product [Ananas comosus var. bracteatus]
MRTWYLRQIIAFLPLCSFAHACEGRSLQAGTPEIAIATYARPCGIGRRSGLPWGGSSLEWDVDYHGAIRHGAGQTAFGWVLYDWDLVTEHAMGTLKLLKWTWTRIVNNDIFTIFALRISDWLHFYV